MTLHSVISYRLAAIFGHDYLLAVVLLVQLTLSLKTAIKPE